MVTFDIPPAVVLGLVVSVVLPLLVGLVTTRVTSAGAKAFLLSGLASVTGLGTELLQALNSGQPYNLGNGAVLAIASFVVAVGSHYGMLKPTGASGVVQDIGVKE